MTLAAYLASKERGGVAALVAKAGVGRMTIYRALHTPLSRRTVAERISKATGGAVSVQELLGIERRNGNRGAASPATRARKA